ncbi:glycosyltransferase family 1 protein [Rahnella variigena]|uniref:glycosyltransferase family 4 protein n=1 Tax=Rahnella variigena TaxID=574964 RepID=UPI00101D4467|nr:glycosyltransferase family 4 protein [Rahnella variigena]RYJ17817.1 glycosyltransferase family 1 protein [Rahnella variigena]
MRKICYFINADWYFDLHWIERAECAQQAGYQIHIISNFVDQSLLTKLNNLGFICHNSSISAQSVNPFKFACELINTTKLIKSINADVLHCITIKPGVFGGLYAKLFSKNIIISFVGLGRVFTENTFKFCLIKRLIKPLYSFIFSNKQCLVTFEHQSDRSCITNFSKIDMDRTVVIDGAGINIIEFPYSREPIRETPVVLFASRLLWSKGLTDLIVVKKRLALEGVAFTLNVAGISTPDDPDSIPLSFLEDAHKNGEINWLGKCDDMKELIKDSNIVALPSIYPEGIPRILLEACSVGRVVISYDVGGCSSLIKNNNNGFIIDKGNVKALAESLKNLVINTDVRARMGENGRSLIEGKFCSKIITKETINLYDYLSNNKNE